VAKGKLHLQFNSIHLGDCIAGMDALPEGSVDLAFADPPFNIGYDYDVYDDRKQREEYLAWSRAWIAAVHRVLKADGTFWLAIGDEYAAELKLVSQDLGFHLRSWVVWYYTFGVNCKEKFSRSHAHLFYFVKDPRRFKFRSEALENRIPSARQLVYADARANPIGRLPDDTWVLRPQDLAECFTAAEDTWYFPRVAGTFKERAGFHGCQMPEQLLARIIRSCSETGELVLDPFSGSATTLAVAKKLARRWLGFDLSPEYVERGRERLESIRVGDELDGAAEPTMSAPRTPRAGEKRIQGKQRSAQSPLTAEALKPEVVRLLESGLREAFRDTSRGFSLDRLVADPELNAAFVDRCRTLGLPGDARTFNRTLFRLRKQGALEIPATIRTEISWQDCDPYLFASEIALRRLADQGAHSLDEVLCDPDLAAQFDGIAASFAPGFTPLEYRWAALKLRKEAKLARSRAQVLVQGLLSQPLPVEERFWKTIPDSPGVYLVCGQTQQSPLYVGQALNLKQRLRGKFAAQPRKAWSAWSAQLAIRFFRAEASPADLIGYQSLLVAEHKPPLNFAHLLVA
jgi:site-specific DNA-methyltransferase (adenine-specific)